MKIIGIILIIAGVLTLAYQGFTYTKTVQDAQIGTLQIQHQQDEHVSIPPIASYVAIGLGVVLLVVPSGGSRRR